MLKTLKDGITLTDLKEEAKSIGYLSCPIIVTMLLHLLTSSTSVIFCGHMGKETLDAVSLASMIINVFGFAITMGLASACDTLFAQSYGSTNKENMGIVLQRGSIILLVTCLPSIAIFINTEHILVAFGQNQYIAHMAGLYTKVFIAGLPGMALSQVLRRFVYTQGIIIPQIAVMVLANIVNVAFHALFIYGLHMGLIGAALAFSITNWSVTIFFALYIVIWKAHKGMWTGFSSQCMDDWGEFFGLAIPGMLMLMMEWVSLEVITFVSGVLGETELAAYTICYNTAMFVAMIPLGLSFGITIRLGINLGRNRPDLARITSRLAMILCFAVSSIIAILMLFLRTVIPYIFTEDSEVIELAENIHLAMAVYVLFSGAELVLDGVIRGSGNQLYGSVVNVFAYLVICLPVAIPLMLMTVLRVKGGYVGLIGSTLFQIIFFTIGILRMDWKKEADMAQERARAVASIKADNGTEIKEQTIINTKPKDYGSSYGENNAGCDAPMYMYDVTEDTKSNVGDEMRETESKEKHKSRSRLIVNRLTLIIFLLAIVGVAIWFDIYLSDWKQRENLFQNDRNITDAIQNITDINKKFKRVYHLFH